MPEQGFVDGPLQIDNHDVWMNVSFIMTYMMQGGINHVFDRLAKSVCGVSQEEW